LHHCNIVLLLSKSEEGAKGVHQRRGAGVLSLIIAGFTDFCRRRFSNGQRFNLLVGMDWGFRLLEG
jgi:hypothetical protein